MYQSHLATMSNLWVLKEGDNDEEEDEKHEKLRDDNDNRINDLAKVKLASPKFVFEFLTC